MFLLEIVLLLTLIGLGGWIVAAWHLWDREYRRPREERPRRD